MNYLQEAQMFDAFAAYGLADWQELYTEEDLTKFFQENVVVLNHNEHHNFDSVVEITPVSSGYHIGSSCWSLQVAHMKISVITNLSVGLDFRHPKKFTGELL